MSLLDFPDTFEILAPHIVIETYARDGGHKHPRHRIELRVGSGSLRQYALEFTMPCVTCGLPIHPFRLRAGRNLRGSSQGIYFAAACPLEASVRCSRTKLAAAEYVAVVEAMGAYQAKKLLAEAEMLLGNDSDLPILMAKEYRQAVVKELAQLRTWKGS